MLFRSVRPHRVTSIASPTTSTSIRKALFEPPSVDQRSSFRKVLQQLSQGVAIADKLDLAEVEGRSVLLDGEDKRSEGGIWDSSLVLVDELDVAVLANRDRKRYASPGWRSTLQSVISHHTPLHSSGRCTHLGLPS